jgi:hypothetical protein
MQPGIRALNKRDFQPFHPEFYVNDRVLPDSQVALPKPVNL